MTKLLTIMSVGFALLGITGCGARQTSTQSTPDQITTKPEGKGCPELQLADADTSSTDESSGDGTSGTEPPPPEEEESGGGGSGIELLACGTGPGGGADEVPDQIVDVRAGASQSRDALTLTACVETLFVGPFSAQVCGSGRGLLWDKNDREPELTHYRVRLRWARASLGRLWLLPTVQAGMSELRAGTVDAGYLPGRGSSRQLALGPAAGAALQLLWPLGGGFELVGDVHLEAAWIPRADELVLPQEELQPALGATLGIGF